VCALTLRLATKLRVIACGAMAGSKRSKRDEDAIKWRALGAYIRYARPGQSHASFDDTKANVIELGSRLYVVLTSGSKQLAVFRVRNDGMLKRMVRPPRELRGPDE
jgi:hypothetical protein